MATATARKTRTTAAKKATAPAKKATTAKPKATAKKAEAAAAEPKPLTRTEVNARLDELGWDGPRSYVMTGMYALLDWVAVGKPQEADSAVPAGAVAHVYPAPKAAKAKRLSKGYLAALADVLAVLDQGGDVREFVTPRLANGEDAA